MNAFICDRCDKIARGQSHPDFVVRITSGTLDELVRSICSGCRYEIEAVIKRKPPAV